jgi:uncharacterized protein (TIGR03435 family)
MLEGATRDQIPAMLQTLLVERFKLAAHKEDRPASAYMLVLDKSGPKFKEAGLSSKDAGQIMFRAGPGTAGFKGPMTMASLAHFLSNRLHQPVEDHTGLKGKYDIDLSWTPDPAFDQPGPYARAFADAPPIADPPPAPAADLFTAIRHSLGSRLEPRKLPVEVLVIDHIDRLRTGN